MPIVSVIIPNYNHADYLIQRIDSVLNQTFKDFEIIILDDSSTDNSREVIEKYKRNAKVTHIVYNEVNSGSTFKQWEKGIKLATGKYIWIAESDDWADDTFLEYLLKGFEIDLGVVLVYCNSVIVDSCGKRIGFTNDFFNDLNKNKWQSGYINNGIDEITNFLSIKNTIPNVSAVIFIKSVFYAITDRSYAHLRLCGDWLFYTEILKQGKIYYDSTPRNFYRQHCNTVRVKSQEGQLIIREYLTVIRKIRQAFKIDNSLYKKSVRHLYYVWHIQLKNNLRSRFELMLLSLFIPRLNPYLPFGRIYSLLTGSKNRWNPRGS